jgi:ATP-dependent DNA helicase RecQ
VTDLLIENSTRAHLILKKVWGYDSFRSPQLEIISSVLAKKDTLALLPTGGGKSLCYQVPGLILPGKIVIVSPLVSLMLDQVRALEEIGIRAKALHSGLTSTEIELVYDNFVHGPLKYLYISPERIDTEDFQTRFYMANVSLIAIDEAHCISQWGHDFRPSYLKVSMLRELKPDVPILALTATATPRIVKDIAEQLYLEDYVTHSKSFARDNISFNVMYADEKMKEVERILQSIKGSTIIYTRSRKGCAQIAAQLDAQGYTSTIYHAGLTFDEREANQKKWMNNRARIIVATNAFGMGIDKKDVRCVIHLDVVSGVEDYYQEAGRAGRDGEQSFAIAIYNQKDIYSAQKVGEVSYPEEGVIKDIYGKLCRYLKVAVGAGVGRSYEIKIANFCEQMKVNYLLFESVLRILEKQEYIEVEYFKDIPSKVTCLSNPSDAREMYKEDDPRGIVYRQLLRMYEGLWDEDPIEISIPKMAILLGMDINTVTHYLKQLMHEGVIWFQPSSSEPEIHFLQPRPSDLDFVLDREKYLELKKEALHRLHYMIEYFVGQRCRQKVLLAYFEEEIGDCCNCDVCKGSFDTNYTISEKKSILKMIFENHTTSILNEVLHKFPMNKRRRINKCLNDLQEEGYIKIENSGSIIRLGKGE